MLRRVEVSAATDRVAVPDFRLPAGDLDLTATVVRGTTREGAYHVFLTRR
jgi:hypothetical protein